jgi:prolyl-tRNA editing enzyme YbaK/EbsC (Cys-tRNA(Pro) deacylase)
MNDLSKAALPDSARRVAEAASAAGLAIEIVEMPDSTRTAEDAAAACGCDVAQIVKSLVFQGAETETPYLLLVSGVNRVDEDGMAAVLGERLKRPNGRAVREITGFAIGGIPPIGHPVPMPTVIDEKLLEFEKVWAAAGTPRCVFSVDPNALAAAAKARRHAF